MSAKTGSSDSMTDGMREPPLMSSPDWDRSDKVSENAICVRTLFVVVVGIPIGFCRCGIARLETSPLLYEDERMRMPNRDGTRNTFIDRDSCLKK